MSVRRLILGIVPSLCAAMALLCIPGAAFGLAGGRAYEMVSPVYKGGHGVSKFQAVTPDGEGVIYYSSGAFEGAPAGPEEYDYYARRGSTGWKTVPLMPPAGLAPDIVEHDVSPSLGEMLIMGKPGTSAESASQGVQEGFWVHATSAPDTEAEWKPIDGLLSETPSEPVEFKYEGASPDFCHVIFADVSLSFGGGSLLPEAAGANLPLYEVDRGCDGEAAALRLVGVRNSLGSQGEPQELESTCQPEVGLQDYDTPKGSAFNAVADDGEVFFTSCVGGLKGPHQVFVRLGGGRTVEVSRPLDAGEEFGGCVGGGVPGEVPCEGAAARPSADFVGASEDGSKVFFTTAAPLEPATDKDAGQDLYMARIGCAEEDPGCSAAEEGVTALTQVSHSPVAGEAAEVQGVVRLTPNGERAYFVARGVLSEAANGRGLLPANGAENLYVYDSATGETTFIADLCSGDGRSGSVEDLACPAGSGASDAFFWNQNGGEAQTAGPDGEYLVFSTFAQLASGDDDSARDVYRYDALSESLERVSIGADGYDANGNNSNYDARIASGTWSAGGRLVLQHESSGRAVSEDGSRIVFSTAEPLSPQAGNGLENVYEWHEAPGGSEGEVSLISPGDGEAPVDEVAISPSGRDVFFVTAQGIAPQDTDGAPDVYDARLGGGEAAGSVEPEPCKGEACLGPLTNPAPLLVPGSAVQAAGGNFAAPSKPKATAKPRRKRKAKKKKSGRRIGKSRGGSVGGRRGALERRGRR